MFRVGLRSTALSWPPTMALYIMVCRGASQSRARKESKEIIVRLTPASRQPTRRRRARRSGRAGSPSAGPNGKKTLRPAWGGSGLLCRPNFNLEVQDTRIPSIAPACVTLESLGLLSSCCARHPKAASNYRSFKTQLDDTIPRPRVFSLPSSPLHTPLFVCLTTGCQPAEPTRDPGLGSENPFPDPSRGE